MHRKMHFIAKLFAQSETRVSPEVPNRENPEGWQLRQSGTVIRSRLVCVGETSMLSMEAAPTAPHQRDNSEEILQSGTGM